MYTTAKVFTAIGAACVAALLGFLVWGGDSKVPGLIVSGSAAFAFLLAGFVFAVVGWSLRGVVKDGLPAGPETERAVEAVLNLFGASQLATRIAPSTVRVEVVNVRADNGLVMVPFTVNVEMEILIRFDEAARKYGYVSTWFGSYGLGMSMQRQYGVMRRTENGKYLTLDGVTAVEFSTGAIYDQIDAALAPLGWSRK